MAFVDETFDLFDRHGRFIFWPFQPPPPHALGCRPHARKPLFLRRSEFGNRNAVAGDGDRLALLDAAQDSGHFGLGLISAYETVHIYLPTTGLKTSLIEGVCQ